MKAEKNQLAMLQIKCQRLIFFSFLCTCNFISPFQNISYINNTVHVSEQRDSDLPDVSILKCVGTF